MSESTHQTELLAKGNAHEPEPEVVVDVRDLGLFYPSSRRRTLFKRFYSKAETRKYWALRHLTFQCQRGDVVGVIGRNGAGKSTLSLVLSNIFEPDEGEVHVKGEVSALLSLGGMFQQNMTGRDNAYYYGAFLGFSRKRMDELIEGIKDFSELGNFFDEPVATYSSGMKSRLAFSIASSIQPDILILDEVLSVGDAGFRAKCEDRIKTMMSSCQCIIVISHSLGSVRKMCNKCIWLDQGQIVESGPVNDVVRSYKKSLEASKQEKTTG